MVSKACCQIAGSLMVLFALGCGGSGDIKPIANLVPCSGTITLDGVPLKQGIVSFAPTTPSAGQPATGPIKDGKFTVATTASAPGIVAGQYKVSVQSFEQAKTGSTNPSDMTKKPVSLVPEKYLDIKQSGLEVEVKKGMPPVKLELVSK
ncbi:MAG: hypothetical protein JWP89_1988 [Schlesneria sp.]|nr:hypothetical protein [Schlesneria sp.]